MKKRYILLIIAVGVSGIAAGITVGKKIEMEQFPKEITILYERQLFTDAELQQQVEAFSSPKNVLELFQQHEQQLNSFAELCYSNRKGKDIFSVEYIDYKRYYFCVSDTDNGSNTEEVPIQKGKYDDITAFMDYAIDSGLVFRDWMLDIHPPYPVEENEFEEKRNSSYGPLLTIAVYKGRGLDLSFIYSPYEDVDYSREEYYIGRNGPPGHLKIARIDAHWYYEYAVEERSTSWWPDPEKLGFTGRY